MSPQAALESVANIRALYEKGVMKLSNFATSLKSVLSSAHTIIANLKVPSPVKLLGFSQSKAAKFSYHYDSTQNIPVPLGFHGNLLSYMGELTLLLADVDKRLGGYIADTDIRLVLLHNQTDLFNKKFPIPTNVVVDTTKVQDGRDKYFTDFKHAFVPLKVLVSSKDELIALEKSSKALHDALTVYHKRGLYVPQLNDLNKRITLMEPTLYAAFDNKTLDQSQIVELLKSVDRTLHHADLLVSAATDAWAAISICNSIFDRM